MTDNNTSHKTIQINPDFFVGRAKSIKRRTQPQTTTRNNAMASLKNKLQKRMLTHKRAETSLPLPHTSLSLPQMGNVVSDPISKDEFGQSVKYFTSMANNRHRTLKTSRAPHININTELPPVFQNDISNISPPQSAPPLPVQVKYTVDTSIPYGCLKNGAKQCYRAWNQTRKRYEQNVFETEDNNNNIENPVNNNARPPTPPKRNGESNLGGGGGEESGNTNARLEKIRKKIAEIQQHAPPPSNTYASLPESCAPKNIKRTIRRRFNLGKSSKYRKVGVLLKNNATRKNISQAHAELKKTPMCDIHKYLRQKNIIKIGSTAPNNVLREMFEMSMLTGDVNNTNGETLVHNFLHTSTD